MATETSIENQIIDRVRSWAATFETKDVDGMMTYYVDGQGFSAFDLMPPIEFRGGPMWRANWVSFFDAWSELALEFAGEEVEANQDLSVYRAMVRLVGVMHGQSVDMWVRQTNCFRLVDGEWLMFHDHVSVPTDFSTGQSLVGLSPELPFG